MQSICRLHERIIIAEGATELMNTDVAVSELLATLDRLTHRL